MKEKLSFSHFYYCLSNFLSLNIFGEFLPLFNSFEAALNFRVFDTQIHFFCYQYKILKAILLLFGKFKANAPSWLRKRKNAFINVP